MTNTKELYKMLSADFGIERKYYFSNLGGGMMQARERDSCRIFLINKTDKEAWTLVGFTGCFEYWNAAAVEICTAFDLPERVQRNAISTLANYYFGVNPFKDGVACVQWTLQPDGCYYADSDGYGMNDDDEINMYAFIVVKPTYSCRSNRWMLDCENRIADKLLILSVISMESLMYV